MFVGGYTVFTLSVRPNERKNESVSVTFCFLKDTNFCLLACGGHPLSPPINSPDNIAHIKGITYLSDYGVIMVCLGGAKKRAIRY